MNYKELNGISIREGFEAFHAANPHIFKAFENQALRAIAKGRTKISAKLILNWIRWHEYLESDDLSFRINDAYQSYYAREFLKKYPEHAGVFELRKLRNEESGPYMEILATQPNKPYNLKQGAISFIKERGEILIKRNDAQKYPT